MTCRLLLDTNVLIDAALPERPQSDEASELIEAAMGGSYLAYISSLSLKDFFYVCRKSITNSVAHTWIETFMESLEVVPVDRTTCQRALKSANPDFEDALIEAAATEARADYLITRDLEGFDGLTIPRLSAAEFLALQEA